MTSSLKTPEDKMPHDLVIRRRSGVIPVDFSEIWEYRELLYFLAWRDIRVKYKQTALGILWALIQPVFTMVVFSVLFGELAKIPSDGIPYPVFVYAGLLPWNYFSTTIGAAGNSLSASSDLISKVYFPRLILPASAAMSVMVDFVTAFTVLAFMMLRYGLIPHPAAFVMLPILTGLLFIMAVGVGLWISALTVEYRDVKYLISFAIQLWMFVTPVIYPVSMVPERYRIFLALNPMAGIIEAFRAVLIGDGAVKWELLAVSAVVGFSLFISGLYYFRRAERTFADVI